MWCQASKVVSDAKSTVEEKERAAIAAGMKVNYRIALQFGLRTEVQHKCPDRRSLEQNRWVHRMADHPLNFKDHLRRNQRVAAGLEQIVINPEAVVLQQLSPEGQHLQFQVCRAGFSCRNGRSRMLGIIRCKCRQRLSKLPPQHLARCSLWQLIEDGDASWDLEGGDMVSEKMSKLGRSCGDAGLQDDRRRNIFSETSMRSREGRCLCDGRVTQQGHVNLDR